VELNDMTLLHAALRYDPPLEIVIRMIQACPHLLSSQDSCRRTPLHIATDSRVNRLLIKYLEKACPKACTMQDVDEMTPLHMACDTSLVLFDDDNGLACSLPSYEII
jgi:hypothetical protein